MPLYLKAADVERLLPMSDALRVVEEAFRRWGQGKAVNNPRQRIRIPAGSLQIMAAADMEGGCGFKAYGGRAGMLVNLYDSRTGEFLAVLEANGLGAIRTGAASGVATRHMAREDAAVLGVIGSGHQAATQVAAVCAVRPIKSIRVFSRLSGHREAFAAQTQKRLGVEARPVASARECVEGADIVVTITNSSEPVFDGAWLAAGAHVNAAGSNSMLRREIDEATIQRAGIIAVDDLAEAKIECGELIHAAERGRFRWEQAVELRHVVAGLARGRNSQAEVTLFESQGLALEDVAAAWHVYHAAKATGIGTPFGG
jgi:ornithine cyclodeaminase/alanine dehydrogenase-like protein (mu-crystallin family)